jgi:hypothetical protein
MVLILLGLVTCCVITIVLGLAVPRTRWLAVIGATVILYLTVLIAWWFALYFQLVPVDRALADVGIYRAEGALGLLIFLGPPLIAALTIVILTLRWKRSRKMRSRRSIREV